MLPASLIIEPIQPFRASVRPPGSKSLTNRALLLAALATGESRLTGVLLADDTQVMLTALRQLGLALTVDEPAQTVTVQGCGGHWPSSHAELFCGNAGTAVRFLTAACSLGEGAYRLDGIERMRQRPIGQLVQPLRELGAEIRCLGQDGYPPLQVRASGLRGGEITMAPTLSSQYISALLQVAPCSRTGLTLNFEGPVTSRPYVEMTLALMHRFGAHIQADSGFRCIKVEPSGYQPLDYDVEPDASNASYFMAAAAVVPGSRCTIEGLGRRSVQGDVGFADVLHQMGAGLTFGSDFITVIGPPAGQPLRGIDVDLNHMPDTAQTLAVVALFADGPTVIRNIGNLRVKETDRIAALQKELTKLGATVGVDGDDMTIQPPPGNRITPAAIDTYDDHRMAMSFAIAGLRPSDAPVLTINDPGCVGKTFPNFFDYLRRLGEQANAR
jgi:3-phosphoshikimate 1-carboxyvinyltransferase